MDARDLADELRHLRQAVAELQAEADIRRIQTRYMFLCDTPCPEPGVTGDADRIERILELYTEDAIWEGVGPQYDRQFGRCVGKPAIRSHFQAFWGEKREPALILNVHYLTSEQIHVRGNEAEGQWVHCQPWMFSDGASILRSSRLNNRFRRTDAGWRISRTRTESVFLAPLSPDWAQGVPDRSVVMSA